MYNKIHDEKMKFFNTPNEYTYQTLRCIKKLLIGVLQWYAHIRYRSPTTNNVFYIIIIIMHSVHRPLLRGLLSPRTVTLELTADIVCIHCFRYRYVTNVNHCIVPKALIVPRSKSMRSRPDNGKNVRRKRHSVP